MGIVKPICNFTAYLALCLLKKDVFWLVIVCILARMLLYGDFSFSLLDITVFSIDSKKCGRLFKLWA